jgi:hypothetical protein
VVKILGLFDSAKVIESPKYTKQRFCCAWLNNNAKGVLKKFLVNHLKEIK